MQYCRVSGLSGHGDAADGPPPHAASARAAAERRRRPAAASVCRARAVGRRRAIVALWQHWRRALSLRGRGVARGAAASPRRGGRCAHVGRPHHSNNVMLTVDLMNGLAFERCYDHQCVVRLPGGGYRKARTFVGEVPAALARCCCAVLENCSSTITSLGSNLSSLNMGKQTPAPLQCSQYSSLETTPGPTRHHASTRAHTSLRYAHSPVSASIARPQTTHSDTGGTRTQRFSAGAFKLRSPRVHACRRDSSKSSSD